MSFCMWSEQLVISESVKGTDEMRRRLVLLMLIAVLGIGLRWCSLEATSALATDPDPAAKDEVSEPSVKTVDLFTANQLHERFESLCSETGGIEFQYDGPLAQPAGSPGLRRLHS